MHERGLRLASLASLWLLSLGGSAAGPPRLATPTAPPSTARSAHAAAEPSARAEDLGVAPFPASPHDVDRTVALAGDGTPTRIATTPEFDGVLHAFVVAEGAGLAREPADGEGREGGPAASEPSAHVRLVAERGREVRLRVTAPAGAEAVTVSFRAAPETDATRALADELRSAHDSARAKLAARSPGEARAILDATLAALGDAPGTEWSEAVNELCWRLSEDAYGAGAPEKANALGSRALRHRLRVLPPDDPALLVSLHTVGTLRWLTGDPRGGEQLLAEVLRRSERTLSPDHPLRVRARMNLGSIRREVGDLAGAAVLLEQVLASCERTLPPDDELRFDAMHNLAALREDMGDREGARLLQERVLEGYERILPADDPDLLRARNNLGHTLWDLGELEPARELFERVLEVRRRTLAPGHPARISTSQNLAGLLGDLGEHERAVELLRETLAECASSRSPRDPLVLRTRFDLAQELASAGDLDGAAREGREVVEGFDAIFPPEHPDRLLAREGLAWTELERGRDDAARALVDELAAALTERAARLTLASPREAREALASDRNLLRLCLFLEDPDPAWTRRLFELVETRRLVATSAPALARLTRADPELARAAEEAQRARAALNDLVARAARAAEPAGTTAEELATWTERRDRAEGRLRRALAEKGERAGVVSAREVAANLPPGAAAVSFLRYPAAARDAESGRVEAAPDRMLAFVLTREEGPRRVELGPASDLEDLVLRWRAALGHPIAAGARSADSGALPVEASSPTGGRERGLRGVPLAGERSAAEEREAGAELRAALLDPVLAAVGGRVDRLFVVPDDVVHLVPLSALPLGGVGDEDARLFDRHLVTWLGSFGGAVGEDEPVEEPVELLLLGDPAYESDGGAADAAAGGLPIARGERGARAALRFPSLPGTRREVESLGELFRETFGREPRVLTGADATKAALRAEVAGARFVHLATHGWFAPEAVPSELDAEARGAGGGRALRISERVAGFAPMTLCGLALAGANAAPDALGRVPGVLTAEELCALDLSRCRLAVLSACETQVGIRRAGQGIASLQAALHVAGARASLTSLWKVDDEATRELMERFYVHLWREDLPVAEALRRAQRDLREAGHPPRDWAAWVASGP